MGYGTIFIRTWTLSSCYDFYYIDIIDGNEILSGWEKYGEKKEVGGDLEV